MIEIFTSSFGAMGRAIAESFPTLFNNLFIVDGKINGYFKVLTFGMVISISMYIFKQIFKKVRMKR